MPLLLALLALLAACSMPQPEAPPTTVPVPAPEDGLGAPEAPATEPPEVTWTGVLDEQAFAKLHQLSLEERPPLRGETITLRDGSSAYLSRPEGEGPHPGVLLIHEWWGLNRHIEHWTDRLAAEGYVALAVDLYGGTVATTREEALAAMKAVDENAAKATLHAGHAYLLGETVRAPRTASIGWCFGGGWSLRAAIQEPELDAAVVYYGRPVTDVEKLRRIHGPVLGVFGSQDEGIPAEAVAGLQAAMAEAGRSFEVRTYDAPHAFANPSNAHYDAVAAEAAWQEVRAFLADALREG